MIVKATPVECTHCNVPVPIGLIDVQRHEQFCCSGCQTAWQLIHANGLDDFYRMVESSDDAKPESLRTRVPQRFDEFDSPEFLEKFATTTGEFSKIKLRIAGIHCSACVWLLEKLPAILPGVVSSSVNWAKLSICIYWNPGHIQLAKIAETLHRLGYTPSPFEMGRFIDHRTKENRAQLVQIGIAAAAAGNNMLVSLALYLGMFSHMTSDIETLLRLASCGLGFVSFLGPGRVFLRGAFSALQTRTPHMDLPIALALVMGTIAGLVNTIRGAGEIYFDSLSVLICLLLIGRWIQFRQQSRAADAVDLLYNLTPRRAMKLIDGQVVDVSADQLIEGDLIRVRPGDLFPSDGNIVEGVSSVDESILTGESRAVHKGLNDPIAAGTMNVDGLLTVKVTSVGEETRIHQMMKLVEDARAKKPEIVQWANRIGGYFVLLVIGLSLLTLGIWLYFDPARATDRVVAVLVISCPCALAMATPLAIAVALGRLARNKILVKSGDVLHSMNKPGVIWLDKTGTLTTGKMQVNSWYGESRWVPVVASIEQNFSHPIAHALVDYARQQNFANLYPNGVGEVKLVVGGIVANIVGSQILIGNRFLIDANRVLLNRHWLEMEDAILSNYQSPVWIAVDNEIVAVASVGDSVRPEAFDLVRDLKRQGWTVGILSGDHARVVESVARELEIDDFAGNLTPQQKLSIVKSSWHNQTTVMVGDGVNDSAALAAATVGIAVAGGAEASLAAAPVYLSQLGLTGIRDLVVAANATAKAIRLNFAISIAYNIVGIGLAISGFLGPLLAAILMPLSSITVVALSLNTARNLNNHTGTSIGPLDSR